VFRRPEPALTRQHAQQHLVAQVGRLRPGHWRQRSQRLALGRARQALAAFVQHHDDTARSAPAAPPPGPADPGRRPATARRCQNRRCRCLSAGRGPATGPASAWATQGLASAQRRGPPPRPVACLNPSPHGPAAPGAAAAPAARGSRCAGAGFAQNRQRVPTRSRQPACGLASGRPARARSRARFQNRRSSDPDCRKAARASLTDPENPGAAAQGWPRAGTWGGAVTSDPLSSKRRSPLLARAVPGPAVSAAGHCVSP
jgi:hypothetical protein